jgi:hypothetical protein
VDETAGHAREGRGLGLLRDAVAAHGLDRLRARRPVRARPLKNAANRLFVLLVGERA